MKFNVSQIWSSPSVRNVGKLLSANVFAQALGLLVYPVLTRMYAPEDFALLNLFASIANVLVLVATAEYQYAIVLPKEDSKARSLVHLCLLLLILVTAVVCCSIPFSRPIARLFNAPDLARYWWLMPLSVFGLGLWNILNYWYIRRSAFTRISGYQITQSVFSVSGKIGFGALGWYHGGMLYATVFAPLLSLLCSIGLAWKKHIRELFSFNREQLKPVAREYANFPKFSLPKAFVNTVSLSLPIWILTPQFGLEAIGQLSLAMMAAVTPLALIARACNQVLFQRVSEQVQQQRSVHSVLHTFILWTGGSMVVGLALIYFVLPQLVSFLFGAKWVEAAIIIRHLFPYLILTPICGAICFLSDVFGKQKTAMWMESGYVIVMTLVLIIGIHISSFIGCVSLFAWTKFAYLAIQLVWFMQLVYSYEKNQ